SIADAFATTPISIPLLSEAQGEAIGFDPFGWGYYTTTELNGTSSAPIHYFDRLPAQAIWTNSSGGAFGTSGNWNAGIVPSAAYAAQFGLTATGSGPTYTVTFAGNVSSAAALAHRDNVTWNLNGAKYTQTGSTGVDSLIVGDSTGEVAALTVTNG